MPKAQSATQFDEYVGEKVRGYRNQLKMSQEALGAKLGVSFQQVQKYEKGTNRLSGARLVQLAGIFNCEVTDLMPDQSTRKERALTNIDRVVATREGVRLIDSFAAIKNEALRAVVVDIAKRLEGL